MTRLVDRAQQLLPPDERVLGAATGQTGVYPLLWWLPYGEFLTMFNGRRVVAVTQNSIVVMQAGRLRFSWSKPRRVLYSLPNTTPVTVPPKRWARVTLGPEKIWMHKSAYGVLLQVLAPFQRAGQTDPQVAAL